MKNGVFVLRVSLIKNINAFCFLPLHQCPGLLFTLLLFIGGIKWPKQGKW